MDFDLSPKVSELSKRLTAFMEEHIYRNMETLERYGTDAQTKEAWLSISESI